MSKEEGKGGRRDGGVESRRKEGRIESRVAGGGEGRSERRLSEEERGRRDEVKEELKVVTVHWEKIIMKMPSSPCLVLKYKEVGSVFVCVAPLGWKECT